MSIHSDRGPALEELPLYRSHREVRAMKIGEVQPNALDGGAILRSADDPRMTVKVDKPYVNLHQPAVGGYYLQLEDRHSYQDGREAFAHGEYFERHYHRVKHESEDAARGVNHAPTGHAEGVGRLPGDPLPADPDAELHEGHDGDDENNFGSGLDLSEINSKNEEKRDNLKAAEQQTHTLSADEIPQHGIYPNPADPSPNASDAPPQPIP
jgi:hypothetical protein